MSIGQIVYDFTRSLSGPRSLSSSVLAAVLVVAGQVPLQAGTCPPCGADDPDICAYNCCLFQNCSSPAGAGCVAFCSYGWLLVEIFGNGDTGPAFKSVIGQTRADCHGDDKVGVISLPPVGSRFTTKKVEIGLISISDKKFLTTPGEVVSVLVEVAGMQDYKKSDGRPRWRTPGSASFDTRAGAWVLDWHLSTYDLTEYVLRARFTLRNGRVQEARAVALTGTESN